MLVARSVVSNSRRISRVGRTRLCSGVANLSCVIGRLDEVVFDMSRSFFAGLLSARYGDGDAALHICKTLNSQRSA